MNYREKWLRSPAEVKDYNVTRHPTGCVTHPAGNKIGTVALSLGAERPEQENEY